MVVILSGNDVSHGWVKSTLIGVLLVLVLVVPVVAVEEGWYSSANVDELQVDLRYIDNSTDYAVARVVVFEYWVDTPVYVTIESDHSIVTANISKPDFAHIQYNVSYYDYNETIWQNETAFTFKKTVYLAVGRSGRFGGVMASTLFSAGSLILPDVHIPVSIPGVSWFHFSSNKPVSEVRWQITDAESAGDGIGGWLADSAVKVLVDLPIVGGFFGFIIPVFASVATFIPLLLRIFVTAPVLVYVVFLILAILHGITTTHGVGDMFYVIARDHAVLARWVADVIRWFVEMAGTVVKMLRG